MTYKYDVLFKLNVIIVNHYYTNVTITIKIKSEK